MANQNKQNTNWKSQNDLNSKQDVNDQSQAGRVGGSATPSSTMTGMRGTGSETNQNTSAADISTNQNQRRR